MKKTIALTNSAIRGAFWEIVVRLTAFMVEYTH